MGKNFLNRNYGFLMVLLSALMFGSYGLWSRLMGADVGNFFQGWTRALIILILIVPIALYRKEIVKIQKRDIGWVVTFMIFTSFTQAPIFYAFNHMDIGSASLLFFVCYFLTMNIIGWAFLNEKITRIKIISSILAALGLYLVFSFSISVFVIFAAIMAVVNGVASGGEVASSKKISVRYSPFYLSILSWAIIFISNGIISMLIREGQIAPSLSIFWIWQICYSIVSLLGFWLVLAGIKHAEAGLGGLVGLMEIVFSIMFGIIVFKEHLTLTVAVGALLIIVATALPNVFNSSSRQAISPEAT